MESPSLMSQTLKVLRSKPKHFTPLYITHKSQSRIINFDVLPNSHLSPSSANSVCCVCMCVCLELKEKGGEMGLVR